MDSPHAITPNTIGSVPSQMNAWVAYHQKRRNETRHPSIWIRLGLDSDTPANDEPAKYWDAGSRPVAIFPEEESGYGKPSLTRGGSVGAFATKRLSDDSVELKIKNGVGLFTGHTMKKGISGATFRANKKMCRVGKAGWMEMEGHVEFHTETEEGTPVPKESEGTPSGFNDPSIPSVLVTQHNEV